MKVELEHISKSFGPLKANNDLSYTFEGGQIYAILGENGAGKSTLMKIIAGYQPPDEGGVIRIDDEIVTIHSPEDAQHFGVGMLYQDPLDFSTMTILENYMTAKAGIGFLPDRKRARAELTALAERFGFAVNPDDLIATRSIGERQQLEILRLLSLNTRFLILDEPTTGISAEQRQQLFSSLKQLAQEDGLIICIVTHKLEDVEALCDAGFVLRHGRMTGAFETPVETSHLVELMFGQSEPFEPRDAAPLGETVLQVSDLTIRTELLHIEGINLDVRSGEVIGLAGLDGSGQNDFMRTCAGLNRLSWVDHATSIVTWLGLLILFDYILGYSNVVFQVTAVIVTLICLAPFVSTLVTSTIQGQSAIAFGGRPTHWLSYRDLRRRGLSYLSAGRLEEGLVRGLSLLQHFGLVAASRYPLVNWRAARHRTETSIGIYDIRGQVSSPIQTLSGGNQQRVALALLPEQLKLIFLENPTRGLDVNSAKNIWQLMLNRRHDGTAIIFSSPDLDEIVQYSDRVMVFSSGRFKLVENAEDINTQNLGALIGGKGL